MPRPPPLPPLPPKPPRPPEAPVRKRVSESESRKTIARTEGHFLLVLNFFAGWECVGNNRRSSVRESGTENFCNLDSPAHPRILQKRRLALSLFLTRQSWLPSKIRPFSPRTPGCSPRCHREPLQDVAETEIESNWDQVVDKFVFYAPRSTLDLADGSFFNSFDNMDLKPELLRGIYAYGYVRSKTLAIISDVFLL